MLNRDRNSLILAAAVTAALIYVYPLFLPTPLLEPDEGLHAAISQEMLEHDEWIVPRFRSKPFLDKPILYFWAHMVSMKAFGMTELAVRLLGLLFGLLGGLTTGLLACRLFDTRTGIMASLMSLTMFLPMALAQAAAHDVALVPFTNMVLLCLWEMERATESKSQRRWLLAAACMFGMAILTKALIGVVIVAVGYGLSLLVSRRLNIGSCVRLMFAIALGAVAASPWYLAMEFRSSGYLYYYFIERHVLGFATATQSHGKAPGYYYAPFLTLGSMPWVWYLAPLLKDEWQNRKTRTGTFPAMVFVACWLVGGILFLCAAKSKLATYALPLFPAIAIFSAVSWQKLANKQLSEASTVWFKMIVRVTGAMGIVTPFATLGACEFLLGVQFPLVSWLAAAVVSAVAIGTTTAFEQQRFNRTVALSSVWVAGLCGLAMTWPLQIFAEQYSERSLAEWINKKGSVPRHVVVVGEKPASVIFYLDRKLRKDLRLDQITGLSIEELVAEGFSAEGMVLAVTKSSQQQTETRQQSIPGKLLDSAGQFHIYKSSPAPRAIQIFRTAWSPDE